MKRNMVALVFGNGNYLNGGVLKNPINDATDVSAKLRSYGFNVIIATDSLNKDMDKKLKDFKLLLSTSEIALFFFAGHGMQIDGRNYLLATDTDVGDETDAKHSSLLLDKVIDVMEKSQAATKIIILDACRDNPWERAWHRTSTTRGLASVYAPKGTIIGFATSPGELASDGKGRNGTYTDALLQHIDEPNCTIETMFKRVRNTIAAETRGKQTSWEHTSLSGNFFFNMSLSQIVSDYKETSLADGLFIVDETKPSHKIIKGLKSYTYTTQNNALAQLSATSVTKLLNDNLFILGRNIYQAACGGANNAYYYVHSFLDATSGFPDEKRKALLDGMLFEVFFNPQAKLRAKIKDNFFNELFDLQKYASLRKSFDFIAETLVASQGKFYAIPGRDHELAVTVATAKVEDDYQVEAVYVDGADVLRLQHDELSTNDENPKPYLRQSSADLAEQLSLELLVPSRLLKITFTPKSAAASQIKFPLGYTVRKA